MARYSLSFLGLAQTAAAASLLLRQESPLSVVVPEQVPEDASAPVDPDFAGLAFEQASWVRYALDDAGETNAFTRNLIDSIYSRTGGKPIIRLGGTSPDYGRYLPGQAEPALPVAEQDNYQHIGGTTLGPSYWPIATHFPDATFMVQVPLATTNVSEAVAWVQAAVEGIGLEQIHSIQIGNEPDLYNNNFTGEGGVYLGPPDYQGDLTNETYVGNYTMYAAAIREAVELPDDFFTALDVAAHVDNHQVAEWLLLPETVLALGLDEDNILKEIAHHYYQNHAGTAEDLETGLMTMNITHRNPDWMRKRINWLRENRPDLPFILNEVGNSLKVTNSYEYQNRLGSALWQVDFYLYALSIGVARFNYQQIMHSGYDLWLPVASAGHEAQVFPNFYSQPFLTDFVGPSSARVAKLEVENAETVPNLAVYGAFEDDAPQRVAIANLAYWNSTSSEGERPNAVIDINVGSGAETVFVTRLTSPDGAGATADSITYAGSQWTYESLGLEIKGVRNDTEVIQVHEGVVRVVVPDSSAAIIHFDTLE